MLKYFNKFFYIGVCLILFGIILLIVPSAAVSAMVRYIACTAIIITGLIKLTFSDKRSIGKREYTIDLVEGFISIVVGVSFFWFHDVMHACITLGLIYLVMPIIRIIFSPNKINQIIMDIFKFVFAGYIFVTSTKHSVSTKIYWSLILIGFGATILIYKYITYRKLKSESDDFYM